ncbi:MAG: hypothetical protein J1F06_07100 [Prevotellaceae bacterium]|nr:hypothetical protein [Prevotellaceae bacterium]
MQTANRVLVNSLALYINMGVTMIVTLLATRYALQALGKEAYGVYMLVANITAMLSFLNVAMAGATQRFLSFSLGACGEKKDLNEVFGASFVLHIGIATVLCLAILVLGAGGIAFLLDIPARFTQSAYVVLACMAAGVMFSVVSVPYEAAMNAHEDIYQIAIINIVDALLKLLAASGLFLFDTGRLPAYALLVMGVSAVTCLLKYGFARRHYAECRYRLRQWPPRQTMRRIVGFAGWNLVGNGASICRYQGTAIVLNAFFGVVVNAAYGIAQQINAFLLFFSNSVIRPLRPLVVKAEGGGDRKRMIRLSFSMTRLTLLMMALVVTPLYINMPFILRLWLGEYPASTIAFCRLFLLITLVLQSGMGLVTAIESEGRIKWLHLGAGLMHILPVPIGYALLQHGYAPTAILVVVLVEEVAATLLRLYLARRQTGLSARRFLFGLLLPAYGALFAAFGAAWFVAATQTEGWSRLLVSGSVHTLLVVVFFLPVLSAEERGKIAEIVRTALSKLLNRH